MYILAEICCRTDIQCFDVTRFFNDIWICPKVSLGPLAIGDQALILLPVNGAGK